MRQEDNSIITLRPSIGQFFINELPLLLLCVAMLLFGGLPGCAYSTLLLVITLLFSLCLLYRFIYLRSIRYHIGSEQLICEHGVFQRSVNYMELYRVVGRMAWWSVTFSRLTVRRVRGTASSTSSGVMSKKPSSSSVSTSSISSSSSVI